MHGETRSWRQPAHKARVRRVLLAALASLPAWSFAASALLAGAPMPMLSDPEQSITLDLDPAHELALRQVAQGRSGELPGDPERYRSAVLVLDEVTLSAAGARGGYFYRIYLAPAGDARGAQQQLVGTLGPFEIAAARQRGETSLRYSLNGVMVVSGSTRLSPLTVSFRRSGAAEGPLIGIGHVRLALSTDATN